MPITIDALTVEFSPLMALDHTLAVIGRTSPQAMAERLELAPYKRRAAARRNGEVRRVPSSFWDD
jgi:hypothetical protein